MDHKTIPIKASARSATRPAFRPAPIQADAVPPRRAPGRPVAHRVHLLVLALGPRPRMRSPPYAIDTLHFNNQTNKNRHHLPLQPRIS
jgi:hypothetical protein